MILSFFLSSPPPSSFFFRSHTFPSQSGDVNVNRIPLIDTYTSGNKVELLQTGKEVFERHNTDVTELKKGDMLLHSAWYVMLGC